MIYINPSVTLINVLFVFTKKWQESYFVHLNLYKLYLFSIEIVNINIIF